MLAPQARSVLTRVPPLHRWHTALLYICCEMNGGVAYAPLQSARTPAEKVQPRKLTSGSRRDSLPSRSRFYGTERFGGSTTKAESARSAPAPPRLKGPVTTGARRQW
ncbi:hypothetical protein SKAU_G00069490 [Synaphobranchus kaupii]|uniref:Uncharacterized protein n=1 Tax=Synaphobranchus kaupii TaxID=118154 RepID=A0A9Q1G6G9_SYNKA|nr:hypothetical protein SKAU_G00069490 [Synaphobranchus kaupii]